MNTRFSVGIIGIGMVGAPLKKYFEEEKTYTRGVDLFLHDIDPAKNMQDDINNAQVVFICVPTPRNAETGACDTSRLESAVSLLTGEKIVVLKSTIPPGTTEAFQKKFPQHAFLFNPEFLTESRAWEDMMRPDRQIMGHTTRSMPYASSVLQLLPQAFFSSPGTLGAYTFTRVNATEAEMGKYAGNVFGALKVTYANILADMCRAMQKNNLSTAYNNIRLLLAHDRRIGDAWLQVEHNVYRGYGGACFPKDVSAFIAYGTELVASMPADDPERTVLKKGIHVLQAMAAYNEALLESQNLTVEDVSVHDNEWIQKRLKTHATVCM